MWMRPARAALLAAALPTSCFALTPKALVVMLDGFRADAVENLDTPNLRKLIRGEWQPGYKCAWTLSASTLRDGSTESAPNHVGIATGMTVAKTKIPWNLQLVTGSVDSRQWPSWLGRLAKAKRGTRCLHIFSWIGDLRVAPDYGVQFIFDRDHENARTLARLMREDYSPDAVMWYIDRPDHAGHGGGYYPYHGRYRAACKESDHEIGKVLDAIASRKTFADEDWLIFITADHGGWRQFHGHLATQCYTVPVIIAGRSVANGHIPGAVHNYDAAPTALAHFGVDVKKIDFDGEVRGKVVDTVQPARPLADGLGVYVSFDGDAAATGAARVEPEIHGTATIRDGGRFGGFLECPASGGSVCLKGSEKLAFEKGNEFALTLWVRTAGPQIRDPVVLCNKDWRGGSNPGVALIASRHVDMSHTAGYNFKEKKHHSPGFMFNCGRVGRKRNDLGVYDAVFGKWIFYAMTRGADGMVRFYQGNPDGELYCIADDVSDIEFATGMPFFVGQDGRGLYERPFAGDVDDLAIWTRTLSHEEVKGIWAAAKAGKSIGDMLQKEER